VSRTLLRCLGDDPEQQQTRDGAVGVQRLLRLQINVRPDGKGEMPIGTRPYRDVAGIAVRQGALHELTRHVRPLDSLGALTDLYGRIEQLIQVGISHSLPSNSRSMMPWCYGTVVAYHHARECVGPERPTSDLLRSDVAGLFGFVINHRWLEPSSRCRVFT
jgi:hypothetical protein